MIAGEEVYWVGEINGEPVVRNVNPVDVTIVIGPDTEYIEDAQAIIEERWMMTGEVIDEFYKSLSPKQIDEIELLRLLLFPHNSLYFSFLLGIIVF